MSDKTKTLIKDLALMIGMPLVLIIFVCTYDDGTDYSSADVDYFEEQAHEEGYNEGYREGYDKGYEEGHYHGYAEGIGDK